MKQYGNYVLLILFFNKIEKEVLGLREKNRVGRDIVNKPFFFLSVKICTLKKEAKREVDKQHCILDLKELYSNIGIQKQTIQIKTFDPSFSAPTIMVDYGSSEQ